MKKILILGGSEFQIPLVKKAKEKGYYVGIVDINPNAPARKYADIMYKASLKDKKRVFEIAKEFNPDGVTVGMVDVAVPTCAYITTKLGLPGLDVETAKRSTDKYEMIKAFEINNVPHPWYVYISKDDIPKGVNNVTYPLIVKPVDMAGSRGIYLVNNQNELMEAMISSSKIGDRGDIILEEYLDGPEVSVELVVKSGEPFVIQVTDKTTSGAPHFAETGHLQPSQLPSITIEEIKTVACAAAKALKLQNSLGHAEIKVTSKGPKMIEIGARAGGDGIAEQLIELSTGVCFSEIALQIALGEEIIIPNRWLNNSSCIRFILSKSGKLQSIDGIDKARKIRYIHDVQVSGIIGEYYDDMIDNSGRLGYVISSSSSAVEAKKACDAAIASIDVKYI